MHVQVMMFTLRTNQTTLGGNAVPGTKQRHEYLCLTVGIDPRDPSPGNLLDSSCAIHFNVITVA